ncbi:Succinate dehydrogenase assembly factor 2 mitochondrial [Spathaspora sp. JA1]|nr:Succinate dehydrogenase assembly factor 2 mitochondrial [Spathaspora sp. JA1]
MIRFTRRNITTSLRAAANFGKPQNPPLDADTLTMKIQPIKRTGETMDIKRARLIYQSRKRGILEADLLLSRFASKYLKQFTSEQLDEYDQLLDESDWDIFYWATKNFTVTPLPEKWQNSEILKLLQESAENKDKEILTMPELDLKE